MLFFTATGGVHLSLCRLNFCAFFECVSVHPQRWFSSQHTIQHYTKPTHNKTKTKTKTKLVVFSTQTQTQTQTQNQLQPSTPQITSTPHKPLVPKNKKATMATEMTPGSTTVAATTPDRSVARGERLYKQAVQQRVRQAPPLSIHKAQQHDTLPLLPHTTNRTVLPRSVPPRRRSTPLPPLVWPTASGLPT